MFYSDEILTKIRKGYFSATYFNHTKEILLQDKNLQIVTMQIFQKQENVTVCGINEVVKLFKSATGYFQDNKWIDKSKEISIHGLTDSNQIKSKESVMHITGPYAYFAHLESLYLGTLARMTKIATNAKQIVISANSKPVIFFADRFDYFLNQEIDGYAAKIGGVTGVATSAQTFLWQGKPTGTIPHSLIAAYNGDTLKAGQKFAEFFPDVPLIILVDFDNDCVQTSLKVAKKFGKKLFAVRLDTSENMVDKSVKKLFGVNPQLVHNVRKALDINGFNHVKIVVSGGFNKEKISLFEKEKTPVDIYGVGSAMIKGNIDFTADIVKVNNKLIAKKGRKFIDNKNFKKLL